MLEVDNSSNKQPLNNHFDYKENIDYSKVVCELRELLGNYLGKNPNVSANGFCAKNNLSSTTINNLLKGITQKKISAENARKIVCGMNMGKSIGAILKSTSGHLGEFLRERYSSLINSNEIESVPLQKIDALNTTNKRIIFILASNELGTNRSEVERTLGKFALRDLDKMIEMKFLIKDEREIIRANKENSKVYVNNDITKEMIKDSTHFSKFPEKASSQIKFLWNNLTPEQLTRQKEIIDEAVIKLRSLYNEEHSSTNKKPAFVSLMADTFTQSEDVEELQ